MTYLDDLAAQIEDEVPAEMLPGDDTRLLFRLYALLALAKGSAVTPSDVHNAWAVWMQETDPDHHAVKPYSELDAATHGPRTGRSSWQSGRSPNGPLIRGPRVL
jgi:hypothetical protein